MRKCTYPQNILIIGNDGNTISCPLEYGNVKLENINNGIMNAWNSSKYDDFRNNLESCLTNPSMICWQCNKLENAGATSLRQEYPLLSEETKLKAIQFKLSNRCQLACAHCGPLLSSSWGKFIGLKDYINTFELKQETIDELISLVPTLSFIRFTGGEPWMDPTHWNILKQLKDVDKKNCELHYITNGLSTIKEDLWKSWKRVHIILSIDGYGEAFEWFRRGAKWNDLVAAVDRLQKIENVDIAINYSLTPWTINYLEKVKEQFPDFKVLGVPVMNPSHCSLGTFTKENYKQLGMAFYPKWKNVIGSNPKNLHTLKLWASEWDKRWKTEGWAEEIHPCLMHI